MSEITREHVLKVLGTVDDPDLKKDLVTLDMIKNLEVDGDKISFDVELTTPACPLKDKIKNVYVFDLISDSPVVYYSYKIYRYYNNHT